MFLKNLFICLLNIRLLPFKVYLINSIFVNYTFSANMSPKFTLNLCHTEIFLQPFSKEFSVNFSEE